MAHQLHDVDLGLTDGWIVVLRSTNNCIADLGLIINWITDLGLTNIWIADLVFANNLIINLENCICIRIGNLLSITGSIIGNEAAPGATI